MSTVLPEVNSDEFFPPTMCGHEKSSKTSSLLANREENISKEYQKEKIVCAAGVDFHVSLDSVVQRQGAHRPKVKAFSTMLHGPCSFENRSGKDTPSGVDACKDPIGYGKKVVSSSSYEPAIFQRTDPRMMSTTVIMRDYVCKTALDVQNLSSVARAVLSNMPDDYVAFLQTFVDNLFGRKMAKYFAVLRAGYHKLLTHKDLDKVAWQTYLNASKACGSKSSDEDASKKASSEKVKQWLVEAMREADSKGIALTPPMAPPVGPYQRSDGYIAFLAASSARTTSMGLLSEDVSRAESTSPPMDPTLPLSNDLDESLNQVSTLNGIVNLPLSDTVFDLKECVRQHERTLKTLEDMCRGAATREEDALLLLHYANEQGLKWRHDQMMVDENGEVRHDRMHVHTFRNVGMRGNDKLRTGDVTEDENPCIGHRVDKWKEIQTARHYIGEWTGRNPVGVGSGHIYQYHWGRPWGEYYGDSAGSKSSACVRGSEVNKTLGFVEDGFEPQGSQLVKGLEEKDIGYAPFRSAGAVVTRPSGCIDPIRTPAPLGEDCIPSLVDAKKLLTSKCPKRLSRRPWHRNPREFDPETATISRDCFKADPNERALYFRAVNTGAAASDFLETFQRSGVLIYEDEFTVTDVPNTSTRYAFPEDSYNNQGSVAIGLPNVLEKQHVLNNYLLANAALVWEIEFHDANGTEPVCFKVGQGGFKDKVSLAAAKLRTFREMAQSYLPSSLSTTLLADAIRLELRNEFGPAELAVCICERNNPPRPSNDMTIMSGVQNVCNLINNLLGNYEVTDTPTPVDNAASDLYKEMLRFYMDALYALKVRQLEIMCGGKVQDVVQVHRDNHIRGNDGGYTIYNTRYIQFLDKLRTVRGTAPQKAAVGDNMSYLFINYPGFVMNIPAQKFQNLLDCVNVDNEHSIASETIRKALSQAYEFGHIDYNMGADHWTRIKRAFHPAIKVVRDLFDAIRMGVGTIGPIAPANDFENLFVHDCIRLHEPNMTPGFLTSGAGAGDAVSEMMIRTFHTAYALILCGVPESTARHMSFFVADEYGDTNPANANQFTGLVPGEAANLIAKFPKFATAARAAYRMGIISGAGDWFGSSRASYYAAKVALHLASEVTASVNDIVGTAMRHADNFMTVNYAFVGYAPTAVALMGGAPALGAPPPPPYQDLYAKAASFIPSIVYNNVPVPVDYFPRTLTTRHLGFIHDMLSVQLAANPPLTVLNKDKGRTIVNSFLQIGTTPYEYLEAAGNPSGILCPSYYDRKNITSNSLLAPSPIGKLAKDKMAAILGYPTMETYTSIMNRKMDSHLTAMIALIQFPAILRGLTQPLPNPFVFNDKLSYSATYSDDIALNCSADAPDTERKGTTLSLMDCVQKISILPPSQQKQLKCQSVGQRVKDALTDFCYLFRRVTRAGAYRGEGSSSSTIAPSYRGENTYRAGEGFRPIMVQELLNRIETEVAASATLSGQALLDKTGEIMLLIQAYKREMNTVEDEEGEYWVRKLASGASHPMAAKQKVAALFPILDGAAYLYQNRAFVNESERPKEAGSEDLSDMHPWVTTLLESFLASHQAYYEEKKVNKGWARAVRTRPDETFPSSMIGAVSVEYFQRHFPLLKTEKSHFSSMLRRIRSLSVMWGKINAVDSDGVQTTGAWMPLSYQQQYELYKAAGIYDNDLNIPANPWPEHAEQGLSKIFRMSYHSAYHCDHPLDQNFEDWKKKVCAYHPPDSTYRPFTRCGGTPVVADFTYHHCSHDPKTDRRRYSRFGFTGAFSIGQQYHDAGLLQDLYSPKYRDFARIEDSVRSRTSSQAYVSNFMAYARNHAIMALSSCNHGTQDISVPSVVRNYFRMFVDTYKCLGGREAESVPVVLGYQVHSTPGKRPVTFYAATLPCINSKLERFCVSDANRDERVCQRFKQVYLNDATLLCLRKHRELIREEEHLENRMKSGLSELDFYKRLVKLQDAQIDFFSSSTIALLLQSGADLKNIPLHVLEPKQMHVQRYEEDTDVVGTDFLSPHTMGLIKQMDFSKDKLTRTELAVLSLLPPQEKVLGTFHIKADMDTVDLEHVRRTLQANAKKKNSNLIEDHARNIISAAFARTYLEGAENVESLDFDKLPFVNPLAAADKVPTYLASSLEDLSSTTSAMAHGSELRKSKTMDSTYNMNREETMRSLEYVHGRVTEMQGKYPELSAKVCMAKANIPRHVQEMYLRQYG